MRILPLILVPPVLLFGFALILMWLPLPQPFPAPLSHGRNLVVAVATGILGIGYIVGLAAYLLSSVRQAGRDLDPVFTSRGLTSQSYQAFGRQYRGHVQGRQVEIDFMPAQGLQPALLNIYVAANLEVRVAMGEQRPLLDCGDCPRVDVSELGLGNLHVCTEETAWTRGLLAEPTNRATVSRLMRDQKRYGLREVYIQPERIWLRAHPSSQATGGQIGQWFEEMLALVEAAERGVLFLTNSRRNQWET